MAYKVPGGNGTFGPDPALDSDVTPISSHSRPGQSVKTLMAGTAPGHSEVFPSEKWPGAASNPAIAGEEAGLLAAVDEQRWLAARRRLSPVNDVRQNPLPVAGLIFVEPLVAAVGSVDREFGFHDVGMIAAFFEREAVLGGVRQLGV